MTVDWPVAVFDDDEHPYVLAAPADLRSWAESEQTADEFTAGFDQNGRPLRLVFADGEPSLVVVGEQDVEALRSLATAVLARLGSTSSVDGLAVAELIGLLREVS